LQNFQIGCKEQLYLLSMESLRANCRKFICMHKEVFPMWIGEAHTMGCMPSLWLPPGSMVGLVLLRSVLFSLPPSIGGRPWRLYSSFFRQIEVRVGYFLCLFHGVLFSFTGKERSFGPYIIYGL
jgi:hypothetical protein